MSITRTIVATAALAATTSVRAQWHEFDVPLADRSGEQAQPKIVTTADGGTYVSWFDNSTGGYDVYLQRLDAAGNELWAHDGVLVADRGFSSTQDYGLGIDASGNALLAFRDDRFGGTQITAARVDPSGTLLWGEDGVQLTADAAFHAAPGIAGASDGGIVVAWTNDVDVKLQRLDAAGVPQWGAGVTLVDDAGGEYLFSDIDAGDAGSVIVSWNRQASFMANKHIYAQKLDASGAALWNRGAALIVFDGGSLQFGNFPDFVPDGAGGAVFGWYSSSPSLQCFAQHVLADGTEAFPHNGVAGSTNAGQLRVSPDVAYDPAADAVFLFWTELNGAQSMRGVSGQKFDADGTRQWTDAGVVIEPLAATERAWVRTIALEGGAIVSFLDGGFGSKDVRVARVDGDGGFVWNPEIIDASSATSGKSRLAMAPDGTGAPVLAWQDARTDANDIYAQRVGTDGTVGGPSCPADVDGNGSVDVADLVAVIVAWGSADPAADIDGNGVVDVADLVLVVTNWGDC